MMKICMTEWTLGICLQTYPQSPFCHTYLHHDEDMYDRMDSGDMFAKMYKMKSEMNKMRSSQEKPWEKMMAQMRFRRDADDSLALNDRLKEKLEGQMEEHMN